MSKTVTVRMDDETYKVVIKHAAKNKRPISNFIEFAVKQYIEDSEFTDDAETIEVLNNRSLMDSLRRGSRDASKRKGKFVN